MMTLSREERLEDERNDRAFALLNGPLFWRFVHALDIIGWKIVPQDPAIGEKRLCVPLGTKRKHWPSWIEDDRDEDDREKPSKLRLIDGGKSDE